MDHSPESCCLDQAFSPADPFFGPKCSDARILSSPTFLFKIKVFALSQYASSQFCPQKMWGNAQDAEDLARLSVFSCPGAVCGAAFRAGEGTDDAALAASTRRGSVQAPTGQSAAACTAGIVDTVAPA